MPMTMKDLNRIMLEPDCTTSIFNIVKKPTKVSKSYCSDSNLNITQSGRAMVYSGNDISYCSCIPNVGYYSSD